jgi:hypothetical protein
MGRNHLAEGLSLLVLTLGFLSVRYFRARRPRPLRAWGWAGLGIILLAEVFLYRGEWWVSLYFTPLVWTGYVLLVDALVGSLRGQSRLGQAPRDFLSLAFWSVPLWLIFEAYNVRLANWAYVGLPDNLLLRSIGYVWSFATIWPAIFETADFVEALGLFREPGKHRAAFNTPSRASIFVLGLLAVTVPVLLPIPVGRYLFGPVWLGFILLLDPLNYHRKGRSLLGDLEAGRTSTLWSFLAAGWVCGILWEFWNYWAGAKWLYVFPIWQRWKIFEMPLPGYLGFPPFALECLVMYEFLRSARKQLPGLRQSPRWEAAGSPP